MFHFTHKLRFTEIIYLSIDSISQSIDDAAQELLTNGHVHNSTGSLDNVALLDQLVVTKHHNADVVRLQVQRHALKKRRNNSYRQSTGPLTF